MDAEATQRYLSWLARDNIMFFFNIVLPNNSRNRERKDFWLQYYNRIRDFQVALSEADVLKFLANQDNAEVRHYSKVSHATTSAFLMKFDGYGGRQYVIVEFSETGNAAYIFKATDFESKGVTMRFPEFDVNRHLKFTKEHRILHVGDWEHKAAYKLASEFGIRP